MSRGGLPFRELLEDQIEQRGRWYFRLAFRVLRDSASAEDACQQAFCKAWERRDQVKDTNALSAWLSRTVINESLGVLRRRRTERRVLAFQDSAPSGCEVEAVARREAIWLALDALEPRIREVVLLRLVEGLSGNEVKDRLGCSASDVSRRLHAGLDSLRQQLAPLVAVKEVHHGQ